MPDIPHAINIYTDGSFKGRDGGSGLVIRYLDDTEDQIVITGRKNTTINRMELRACIEAFKKIQKDPRADKCNFVCIHTDSQHIIDNYKKVIFGNWQGEPWKKKDGNDFANKDLWQEFTRELRKTRKRIELYKVKSHSGNIGNEAADKLAKKSREGIKKDDYGNKKGIIRRWLDINESKKDVLPSPKFILYVQRIKPRTKFFDAHVQFLRPKKYLGVRLIIRGEIKSHHIHVGHIHVMRLIKDEYKNLIIKDVIKDIGRPRDNKNLWNKK